MEDLNSADELQKIQEVLLRNLESLVRTLSAISGPS